MTDNQQRAAELWAELGNGSPDFEPEWAIEEALDAAEARGRAENPCATCVREGGPYRCCAHCADDAIHDVPENQHDLPCQTCLMDAEARGRAYMAAEIEALATVMQATSAPAPVIRALRALVADIAPKGEP